MALRKVDIVDKISDRLGYKKYETADYIEALLAIIKETLESGKNIKIAGFGVFEIKQKADRKGRNPATGDSIILPARRVVTFKTSTILRDAINEDKGSVE